MNSDLLKARKLKQELSKLACEKEDEIEKLTENFVFQPKHSKQSRAPIVKFELNFKDEINLRTSDYIDLYEDDLGEFFDYIDKIKAEYHNFLKDKEQGI